MQGRQRLKVEKDGTRVWKRRVRGPQARWVFKDPANRSFKEVLHGDYSLHLCSIPANSPCTSLR